MVGWGEERRRSPPVMKIDVSQAKKHPDRWQERDTHTLLPGLLPTSLTLDTNKTESVFSLLIPLPLPSEERRSFVPSAPSF